jgi:hypothetical protein
MHGETYVQWRLVKGERGLISKTTVGKIMGPLRTVGSADRTKVLEIRSEHAAYMKTSFICYFELDIRHVNHPIVRPSELNIHCYG